MNIFKHDVKECTHAQIHSETDADTDRLKQTDTPTHGVKHAGMPTLCIGMQALRCMYDAVPMHAHSCGKFKIIMGLGASARELGKYRDTRKLGQRGKHRDTQKLG